MGEEICTVCRDDDYAKSNDSNLSSKNFIKNDKNIYESQKSNGNNNNENGKIIYDNPLSNISVNESMNLGNCYIGTNNNNKNLKLYKPENTLKTLMSKNKITLDSTDNNNSIYKLNEAPNNKRISLTTKNENKKELDFNFKNSPLNSITGKKMIIIPKQYNNYNDNNIIYNNSNNKNVNDNNPKYNNMSFSNSNFSKLNNNKNNNVNYLNAKDENYFLNNYNSNNKLKNNKKINFNNNNNNNDISDKNENDNNKKEDNDSYNNNNRYDKILGSEINNDIFVNNNYKKKPNDIKNISINNKNTNSSKIFKIRKERSEKELEQLQNKLNMLYLKYNFKLLYKIYTKKYNKSNINKVNIDDNDNTSIYQSKEINVTYKLNMIDEYDVDLYPDKNCLFIGEKSNDKKNGLGLEIFEDSNAYFFGNFKDDKRYGFCKFLIDNMTHNYKYLGEVNDIYAEGYGLFRNYETNTKYEGEWSKSMRNGIGIEVYHKSFYQGCYLNGKRHGIGEYYWEKNVFYMGEWKNNLMDGYGIYSFNNNAIYEGSWENNKMNGFGILNSKNNKIYMGFFENDYKSGFGIKIWINDNKAFVGFWKDNKQNGFGKIFYHDKTAYGNWKNGKIVNKIEDREIIDSIFNDINKYFLSFFELRNYEEVKQKINDYI